MPPTYVYECAECGVQRQFPRSGVRLRHACQECGAITTWERGDPVAAGGTA
jgi:DNA-directed RNA polymerase subunit RPC12/RpoP